MTRQKKDLLQGTLDLLILRTLTLEPMHGFGISKRLEQVTRGVFQVNAGSFFPALYRLEQEGWIDGEWGRSENNRRARFYSLTRAGRRKMAKEEKKWETAQLAIGRVLEATR